VAVATDCRVVIIDDDRLLTDALALAWQREPDMEIVGVANTAAAGLDLTRRERPNVVLVDYNLPDMSGSDAIAQLREELPDVASVIMTIDPSDQAIMAAIDAGANGFLPKTEGMSRVADAVRKAANGEMLITGARVAQLMALARGPDPLPARPRIGAFEPLTMRETEVLQLMAQGLDTAALADRLMLSQTTVRTHVAAILSKLDAHSRLEAVVKASRAGLLP